MKTRKISLMEFIALMLGSDEKSKMRRQTFLVYLFLNMVNIMAFMCIAELQYAYLEQKGLNEADFGMINTFSAIAIMVVEIPSGLLADRWGRRKLLILASALYALGYLLYGVGSSTPVFLLGEASAALGMAFFSGTIGAWLVDRQYHYGFPRDVPLLTLYIPGIISKMLGGVIGGLLGGWVASTWGMNWSFLLSGAISGFLAVFCFAMIREEYRDVEAELKGSLSGYILTLKKAIKTCLTGQNVRFALLLGALIAFVESASKIVGQPTVLSRIKQNSEEFMSLSGAASLDKASMVKFLGSFGALMQPAAIVGLIFSVILLKLLAKEKSAMILLAVLLGVVFWIVGTNSTIAGTLGGVLVYKMLLSAFAPINQSLVDRSITKDERATVFSLISMVNQGAAALGAYATGYLITLASQKIAWGAIGVFIIGAALLLSLVIFLRPQED